MKKEKYPNIKPYSNIIDVVNMNQEGNVAGPKKDISDNPEGNESDNKTETGFVEKELDEIDKIVVKTNNTTEIQKALFDNDLDVPGSESYSIKESRGKISERASRYVNIFGAIF